MSRRPIVAGNWKMNLLRSDAEAFSAALASEVGSQPPVDVVLFPPAVLIDTVVEGFEGTPFEVGGQDVHPAASGAHTGDISAPQLLDAGCAWTLVGHSERRRDHGEDDHLVGRKASAAAQHGLRPMICVGETAKEREAEATFEVLERQLDAALGEGLLGGADFALAYEPVWAIGTGLTATPELAQEAHAHLRHLLGQRLGASVAAGIRVLYGGSAKPGNVAALFAGPDVDGFLVGGASLDSSSFWAMISACADR
ncbi:MAG: triose-phosphate isomerase [Acidobacteriota bacterium]